MTDFEEMTLEEVMELVEEVAKDRLEALGYDIKMGEDGRPKPADEGDAS